MPAEEGIQESREGPVVSPLGPRLRGIDAWTMSVFGCWHPLILPACLWSSVILDF